ncbi:DUF1559 domain-containing protein [bacterium]|nr:DUF1559 domain-containing protein [bacterium]
MMSIVKRFRPWIVSGFAIAAILAASPASAQEKSKSLAARFPAEGLAFYLEFDGLTAHAKAWQKTQFHGLLNKTTMGDLARDLARQGAEQIAKSANEDGGGDEFDAKTIERIADDLLRGGFAFGLYMPEGSEEPAPMLVGRNLGKGMDRKTLEAYLPKSDRSETRAGRSMRLRGNGSGPVTWWEKDDVMIVDAAIVDRAVATVEGKGGNAASHPILNGLKGGSAAFEPVARGFVDFARIPLPPQARKLGLDGVRHIEMLGGFEDAQIRTIVRVVAPAPRKGLLSILDGPGFAADGLPPIHPSASGFTAMSIEPGAIFAKITDAIKATDPATGRQIDTFLNQFKTQTGISLVDDVLKAVGPAMSFGTVPERARNGGDMFATVELKDGVAFARTLDKLAPVLAAIVDQALKAQAGPNAGGFEIRKAEGGKAEWVVKLPGGLAPVLEQISPRIRIDKETLIFAFETRSLDMLQQIEARKTPYAFRGDYAFIGQRMPKTTVYLAVQDARTNFPALISSIPMFIQGIDQAAQADGNPPLPIRIDRNQVPSAESMAPFLTPSMVTVSVHPEGIKLDSSASVPSIDSPAAVGVTVALLLPAVQSAREAARRAQCFNNHKQIALAMHNYADANKGFPPMAITGKNGEPLLSWRVALLPYLEQQQLYEAIRKDEPWDSPHNRPLMSRMPAVFACPTNELEPGMTCCRAFVGDGGILEKDKTTPLSTIRDGTSNTIMFAEAAEPVEWMRPEGLPVNAPGLLGLGSKHPGGFVAAFADGSVRFISSRVSPRTLKGLATKDGGEVVSP